MRRSKLQRTDGSRELARCAGADIFSLPSPPSAARGQAMMGGRAVSAAISFPTAGGGPGLTRAGEGGRPGPRVRNASSISHQPAKLAYACAFLRIPP